MKRRWRGRRGPWGVVVVALGILVLGSGRMPAAQDAPAAGGVGGEEVYDMVYPLLGEHSLTDSFGDPRGRARRHEGVDLLAERMVPVVAVADGTVRWVHSTRGGNCCDVAVLHDDGWRSRYIHLNNDTPGTDDGRAVGIAPGIREGARVNAGQLIGWVGDSGNAESTVPHLHFELRRPDGTPVDPFPSLKAALRTGRPLAPARSAPGAKAEGGEEEHRGGLWRWLLGRDRKREPAEEGAAEEEAAMAPPPEPEVVPAPPMPADEGEPLRQEEPPEDEDPGTGTGAGEAAAASRAAPREAATPAPPADAPVPVAPARPGALPGLGMDRAVEELPVEPATRAEEAGRSGGWLSCFGFSGDEQEEPAAGGSSAP